ncbi:MAG: hypothetical protein KAT68_15550 [Bacteroidales bacterium]|nr:hypothetical protein [Bacteroidales bacterium]
MKALKFSIILILLLTQSFGFLYASNEFTKKFHEEFQVDKSTILEIQNKFGDVNVNNWDKDLVSINITITVKESREEKAEKIFEKIKITLEKDNNTVKAITEIIDKIKNTKFSIDYEIHTPAYIKLNLTNKFGNVFINEITGKSNIIIKYGNLEANKIMGDNSKPLSTLTLGYCGKANINEYNWGKLFIKYSKINIEKSQALIVISKYSKVGVENVSSIISEAGYDTYRIGKIQNFVTVGKYTEFNIETLTNKLDAEIKYGNCKITEVPVDFKSIKIVAKYAAINIGINPGASYQLDADIEYANINYPEGGRISKIKNNTELKVSGTIGNKTSSKSTVVIESKYGNVDLMY